jgi:hypothetical protein
MPPRNRIATEKFIKHGYAQTRFARETAWAEFLSHFLPLATKSIPIAERTAKPKATPATTQPKTKAPKAKTKTAPKDTAAAKQGEAA